MSRGHVSAYGCHAFLTLHVECVMVLWVQVLRTLRAWMSQALCWRGAAQTLGCMSRRWEGPLRGSARCPSQQVPPCILPRLFTIVQECRRCSAGDLCAQLSSPQTPEPGVSCQQRRHSMLLHGLYSSCSGEESPGAAH